MAWKSTCRDESTNLEDVTAYEASNQIIERVIVVPRREIQAGRSQAHHRRQQVRGGKLQVLHRLPGFVQEPAVGHAYLNAGLPKPATLSIQRSR